ncbi:LOW QUALITY PROTEIN: keratin, type II cytoskeletal 7-like [Spheniscus humboldti]
MMSKISEVHYWMHTYFTKHPRLTVSLRVQIHMTPHHLARTEDLVGPMLSWLLNIAFYSYVARTRSSLLMYFGKKLSCSKHNCSDMNTLSSINWMEARGEDLVYFKPGDSPLSNDTQKPCPLQQVGWASESELVTLDFLGLNKDKEGSLESNISDIILSFTTSASMSQQLSAGSSFHGRKFLPSSSAVSGMSRCQSSTFPSAVLFGRGYGAWSHSSQSLQNTDGCKWISSGQSLSQGVCGGWGCRGIHAKSEGGSHGLGFHSRSCKSEGIRAVHVSESLLQPLDVKIDPEIQHIKQEREQMKSLNNQFASLIDKVQHLEQQNRVLATKWALLQKQVLPSQKNIKHVFDNFICILQRQLDSLLHERGQMEPELNDTEKLVEEFRCEYEQAMDRHTAAETEFVLLKKDVDCVYLTKTELEAKLETLKQERDFLKCVSAQEIAALETSPCDTSVVKMDNSRGLDMEGIFRSAECWYEDIGQKSKAELDALYRTRVSCSIHRYQELEEAKGRHCNELKSHQQEIEKLSFVIQRRQCDLENMKKQVSSLQTSVCDIEQRGDCALKDAREKHTELQNALQKAKDELVMLRDYQELLNVKLALDIEIATTLLEGEESRICLGSPVRVLITTPCNTISGCEADLGCGSAGQSRRCRGEDFNWTSMPLEHPDLNFSCESQDNQDCMENECVATWFLGFPKNTEMPYS